MTIPADTLAAQRRASDPAASAWVAANAGSGKTHVLAQRVVRLLLRGTPPGKILCLTFTRAAAANMSQRVFGMLSRWTLLDDEALKAAIRDTGEADPAPGQLQFARRLFARTIETPGGLKINTIHAFCERLLHLFPFEANVASGFSVIEELDRTELMERARSATLKAAVRGEEGLDAPLRALAGETTPGQFEDLLREALGHRAIIAARDGEPPGEALRQLLQLRAGETPEEIARAMLEDGIAPARWAKMIAMFKTGSSNDLDQAARMGSALAAHEAGQCDEALIQYSSVFFTKTESKIRKTFVTGAIAARNPKVVAVLDAEARRLETLLEKRRAAAVLLRTTALLALASAIFARYERMKRDRGLLDFDDLIRGVRNLFGRSDAGWVLYKLDAGIDHILVDEAQDTSPAQWEILEAIAREFTAGRGQREQHRSFFAVGDEKQSIFSFQGAAPQMFARERGRFAARAEAARQRFEAVSLTRSFRSAPEVLAAVDIVFKDNFAGLSADDNAPPVHEAVKTHLPGYVELWDVFGPMASEAPADWRLPLDNRHPRDPANRLASAIAARIEEMTRPGSRARVTGADGRPRPVRPGDIMVLVRARNAIFSGTIRALKDKGVEVAGADRLKLTRHIAVMDLIAIGRITLLPQDDLTLAAVLKCPLVGLDDDDLTDIAAQRGPASLWQALEAAVAPRPREAARLLRDWRAQAQAMTPFSFYMHLMGAQRGRHQLLSRLGMEAGDAIDEFLRLALAHERREPPSLAVFLGQLEAADLEIKRDMEGAGNAVRVMTVHAAKGLEAKIVFLPDTCGRPGAPQDPDLFKLEAGDGEVLAWSPRNKDDPALVATAREKVRKLAVEEHRRLLYVAMTRAEEQLYIAGFAGGNGPAKGCWHEQIGAALQGEMAAAPALPGETTQTWTYGVPARGEAGAPPPEANPPARLPAWLLQPAAAEAAPSPPLSPSRALAAADQGEPAEVAANAQARAAGRLMHQLLQHLPQLARGQRAAAGERFLAARGAGQSVLRRALAVLETPGLEPLFAPDSAAEVTVGGRVPRPGRPDLAVAGRIDRLAITPGEVIIADYKGGPARSAAQTPIAHITQLALYGAVLQQLHPGKRIRALIVWTGGPAAVEIDGATLATALALVKLA